MIDSRHVRAADESGDIIISWLSRLLTFLAVLSFVDHEVIAVVVTDVNPDETAREVARAASDEYRVARSIEVVTATEVAAVHGARVVEVVGRDAPTLVIHRVGPFQNLVNVSTAARVAWAP